VAYNQQLRPRYPIRAIRRGEQGTVQLKVLVGPDGSVQQVQIESSSGYRDLDRSAMQAVRKYHFRPGIVNGVHTATWVTVPITFKLNQSGF